MTKVAEPLVFRVGCFDAVLFGTSLQIRYAWCAARECVEFFSRTATSTDLKLPNWISSEFPIQPFWSPLLSTAVEFSSLWGASGNANSVGLPWTGLPGLSVVTKVMFLFCSLVQTEQFQQARRSASGLHRCAACEFRLAMWHFMSCRVARTGPRTKLDVAKKDGSKSKDVGPRYVGNTFTSFLSRKASR